MRKIAKIIINIPNIPFKLIVALYISFKIAKETGLTELTMMDIDDIKNSNELKGLKDKFYPIHFQLFVAFIFYISVAIHLIL